MPKIEVNEDVFFALAGRRFAGREEFGEALTCAKAELDEDSDKSLPQAERSLKIELNDTNRPDLWATAGLARQLRVYFGGKIPEYPFFSRPGAPASAGRTVKVEAGVQGVRPFLAGFTARGKAVTGAGLRDMIQTQEKLAWNFGRKRRTVSMGLYRAGIIKWPVIYRAVDPDSVSFVPLQWDAPLTLREILKQHPKGREYAFIQEQEPLHPLLLDSAGNILSYPPIINSADTGAVQPGDTEIFVELTGADMPSVALSASIMACDLADQGFVIDPVEVEYEYDTPFGRNVVFPYYFQGSVFCSLERIEKFLGEKIDAPDCVKALARMGVRAEAKRSAERGRQAEREGVLAFPPEYRNDYLHAADVMEDVMIGRGLGSFRPENPGDFTVGRLLPLTVFSRRVKELFVGLGYEEMIFNYLGSRKDLVENMRGGGERIIRIANPMTENYEYVRDSIIASLLQSESASGHSMYPHRIFETGKIAFRDESVDYRTVTRHCAGFLYAGQDANFSAAAAQMRTLFYYLGRDYAVEEISDSRFIPGRAVKILYDGKAAGFFGEVHPEVLENWGVTVPCAAGEIDIEALLEPGGG